MRDSKIQVILVTMPSLQDATVLSKILVENKLCACVSILPGVVSIFSWENKIQQDQEVLMLIKTQAKHFKALALTIEKNHPYDVPEILALSADEVSDKYQQWLISVT